MPIGVFWTIFADWMQRCSMTVLFGEDAPAGSDGFRILSTGQPNDFGFRHGILLVGGKVVQIDADFHYTTQPNFNNATVTLADQINGQFAGEIAEPTGFLVPTHLDNGNGSVSDEPTTAATVIQGHFLRQDGCFTPSRQVVASMRRPITSSTPS
jgi:hypothetical protein